MTASDNHLRQKLIAQLELSLELAEDVSFKTDLRLALGSLKDESNSVAPVVRLDEAPAPVTDNYDDEDYDDEDEYWDDEDGDEDYEPVVPNGFDSAEEYERFLETQAEHLTTQEVDEETGEVYEHTNHAYDVAGFVEKEDGEVVEVGNLDESLDSLHAQVLEDRTIVDEETNEVIVNMGMDDVEGLRVRITRNDNNALSEDVVRNTILAHPQSAMMLRVFGRDFTIVDADEANSKDVIFTLGEDDERARKAGQLIVNRPDMVAFAGTIVVPGVGSVSAKTVLD